MDTIYFCALMVCFAALVCVLFYQAAFQEEGERGWAARCAERTSFCRAWWRQLLEPEARLAVAAAAICLAILSL